MIKDIVSNARVYGLENSFRVSKFPMSVDASKCNTDYTNTIKKLGSGERIIDFQSGVIYVNGLKRCHIRN